MSLVLTPEVTAPDSHALCRAIAGLPNDEISAALAKVTGSAGRWSGTAGLAIGERGTAEVRFPIGDLAEVFSPKARDAGRARSIPEAATAGHASIPTFTAEELGRFLAALIRSRPASPPRLESHTLANGLTIWGKSGSCATHVAGMYATPDLSRVLVYAYRPTATPAASASPTTTPSPSPSDDHFGQRIVRAAFDPDAIPLW